MALFAALSSVVPLAIVGFFSYAALRYGLESIALGQVRDALNGEYALIEEEWKRVESGERDRSIALARIRRLLSGPVASIHLSARGAAEFRDILGRIGLEAENAGTGAVGNALFLEGRRVGGREREDEWVIDEREAVAKIGLRLMGLPLVEQYALANGPARITLWHDLSQAVLRIRNSGYVWAMIGGPSEVSGPFYMPVHPRLAMIDADTMVNERGVPIGHELSNMTGRIDTLQDGEFVRYDYLWRNPEEDRSRRKIILMRYFKPWNWVLCAGLYGDEVFSILRGAQFVMVAGVMVFGLLFFLLAYHSARGLVARRAALLAGELGRVETGDYHLDLPQDWKDEFGTIARAAQRMAQGIQEREEGLRRSQKLEAVGRLAAGLAHDVNNTLAGILGASSLLRLDLDEGRLPDPVTLRETLDSIDWATRRASLVTKRLLSFSRKRDPVLARLDLAELIEGTIRLSRRSFEPSVVVRWERPSGSFPVLGEEGQLEQVFMNLLLNARDAVTIMRPQDRRPEGRISVSLGPARSETAEAFWEVTIEDDGEGMGPEALSRVFEPFYSTKGPERGTGLGLTVARGITQRHGGSIELESESGRGTRVRVRLPVAPAAEIESERPTTPVPQGSGRILLAEDDPAFRTFGAHMLEECGYEVETAADGNAALECFLSEPGAWVAVVLDVAMPGLSGPEACEGMRRERPGLPVLVISGYGEGERVEEMLASGPSVFLHKPFDLGELARALASLLSGATPPQD